MGRGISEQLMYAVLAFALVLVGLHGARALEDELVVRQGEILTIVGDPGVRGPVADARATFAIAEWGYFRDTRLTSTRDPVFRESIRVRAAPGTYELTIRLEVNRETVRYQRIPVTVIPANAVYPGTTGSTPGNTASPQPGPTTGSAGAGNQQSVEQTATPVREALIVPPIPDVVPGETVVLSLTMRGRGTYDVDIPAVPFGTLEYPPSIATLRGEARVPVLVRVDPDASPGTYRFPIFVGNEEAEGRVRVIAYRERDAPWAVLIGIGIALLILAVLLAVFGRRGMPPRERKDAGDGHDGEHRERADERLITYY